MRYPGQVRLIAAGAMLLLAATSGSAQQPAASVSGAVPAGAPPSVAQRLGVYVFPAKGQSTTKQASDENTCFSWAEAQSGIDPFASSSQADSTAQQQPAQGTSGASKAGQGSTVRGAAGGAAIGAAAGNAGKGAAIGATVGVLHRARVRRQAQEQAEEQQQAQAAAAKQREAQASQQRATYNKAFSACLEGKGYTVK